jgi:molybdopterin-containing oxidoreductase family iron-sulfur binding subunit
MTQHTDSTNPLDLVADDSEPADADADPDLGRRMGKDAQRVWRGELSEQEFYEKYHEDVVDEFGADDRPVGENR